MLGNLVYDGEGEITEVTSIVDDAINYALDFGHLWLDEENHFENLTPIPLTEEWLIKTLGFKRVNHGYSMNDGSMNYHYELNNDKNFMLYFDGRCFAINESKISHRAHLAHNKHVHQLQNLWMTKTGQELTITQEN